MTRLSIGMITALALAGCSFDPALPGGIVCNDASPSCPEGYSCNGKACVADDQTDGGADGPRPDLPLDRGAEAAPDVRPDQPHPDLPLQDKQVEDLPGVDLPDAAVDLVGPGPDKLLPDMPPPDQLQPDQSTPTTSCAHPPVVKRCQDGWCAIPPGCFTMGSPTTESCRDSATEDQHQVTLTHSFEIAATEVTRRQFIAALGHAPLPSKYHCSSDDCAADGASWDDAAYYCNRLSSVRGVDSCYTCTVAGKLYSCSVDPKYAGGKLNDCPGFRLPTDAEWEYAYRAGTKTPFYNGPIKNCTGTDTNASKLGWYKANSNKVQTVANLAANKWGLHDMGGNLAEWAHDFFVAKLGTSPQVDPVGPASGTKFVIRNGSILGEPRDLRAAGRGGDTSTKGKQWGFRCARTLCKAAFHDDFDDNDITDWTAGSLVYRHPNTKQVLPQALGGFYRHASSGTGAGGHHRKLAQPITGVAFELHARVRGDATKANGVSFGLFRNDKVVQEPKGGLMGHGYFGHWLASQQRVEVWITDGAAGQKLLAQSMLPSKMGNWHHLVVKRRFDGYWEILVDGQQAPLGFNEPDNRFTTLTHVSTYLPQDSTQRALDDIQALDCRDDSGPSGRIAYVSNKGGKYETWIMDSDGRNGRQVSSKAASSSINDGAAQPRISRYGDKVAFYYRHPSLAAQQRLGVVTLKDLTYKEVLKGISPYGLDWTPDDQIFYVKYVHNTDDLYQASPTGTPAAKLVYAGASGWGIVSSVAHHPMDLRTGFIEAASGAKVGKVCAVDDRDTTNKACYSLSNLGGESRWMDWAADGQRLAYFQVNGSKRDLYWVSANSGPANIITSSNASSLLSFGKDDQSVYYGGKDIAGKYQIYRVDLTGANKMQLTMGSADNLDPHFYPYLPNPVGKWRGSAHNPVLTTKANTWPAKLSGSPDVVWDGKEYKMYYHGCPTTSTVCNASIGLATSPDGIRWTRHPGNPVIKAGSTTVNTANAWMPTVVYHSGSYHMWYVANQTKCGSAGITYASSSDGKVWKHQAGLVLSSSQSWEGMGLWHPTVIRDGNSYRMWYQSDGCAASTCGCTAPVKYHTGYASSSDGKTWIKYPSNPIFAPGKQGTHDALAAAGPDVVKIGATFHMWYSSQASSSKPIHVSHATSADGATWVRDPASPVVSAGAAWSKSANHLPSVVVRGSFLQMWTTGADNIGYHAIAP